jgi:DNA-binding transcriptional MerR regulator
VDGSGDLLTIGVFGRRVGLTPSALRFYDDCGVLRPAWVDEGTGYRYYTSGQEERGRLLRDLRAVDLPLTEVRAVLDGSPQESARVLREHVRNAADKAEATRAAAERILNGLPPADLTCTVVLGGPELASAVRQVTPAAAGPGGELPLLAGVRLETDADEVAVVATDRYRLAMRKLHPAGFSGTARPVVVPADELSGLAGWFAAANQVELTIAADGVTVRRDGETRAIAALPGEYPAYRLILDDLPPFTTRALADRAGLLDAVSTHQDKDGTVVLSLDGAGVSVQDGPTVQAVCSGEPRRIGFSAGFLGAALDASVGPDVLLEIVAQDRPVVVRSADQGTFTTLVMPVRLDA